MNGLLVIDKPGGITSHDVVARVRRVLGERRVGHAGTLDPMATGVLVLGVGRATRLLRFAEAHEKAYEADVVFGVETTTYDAEGEVTATRDASPLTAEAVEEALDAFRGEIEQVPPMVSALKVGGERLYEKARRGEEVERAARRVTVHELRMPSFVPGAAARALLVVRCSKGTYVRSLAADLGRALGVGAHLRGLRRTAVGPWSERDAAELASVGPGALRPMEEVVSGYPRRVVDETEARALVQGKPLRAAGIDGPYAVFGPDGLLAMVEDRGEVARSLCVVSVS